MCYRSPGPGWKYLIISPILRHPSNEVFNNWLLCLFSFTVNQPLRVTFQIYLRCRTLSNYKKTLSFSFCNYPFVTTVNIAKRYLNPAIYEMIVICTNFPISTINVAHTMAFALIYVVTRNILSWPCNYMFHNQENWNDNNANSVNVLGNKKDGTFNRLLFPRKVRTSEYWNHFHTFLSKFEPITFTH